MASIRKEIPLESRAEDVWDAVRDIGALHGRLVPGFVVNTRLEASARIVTFGCGLVVREMIVDLDDLPRRLAWPARGGRLTHHNASAQVLTDGEGRTRLVWMADLLPDECGGDIRAMIQQDAAENTPGTAMTHPRRADVHTSRSDRAHLSRPGSSAPDRLSVPRQ